MTTKKLDSTIEYVSEALDLSSTCRICMARCIELYSLSTSHCTEYFQHLACIEKIRLCTNVQINENDGLPYSICQACVHLLDKAYEFKITCENSDEELRKIVQTTIAVPGSNRNNHIKDEQDLDVTSQCLDSYDVIISEKNDSKNKYKCIDNFGVLAGSNLKGLGVNKCNEELGEKLIIVKKYEVNQSTKLDVEKKCKPTNNSRPNELLRQKLVIKNIEKDTTDDSFSPVTEIFDIAENENSEPELEHNNTGIKRGVRKLRKLKCRGCSETFHDKSTRNEHQRLHGVRTYICDICDKGFFGYTTYYTHRISHFPPKFSCEKCPYKTWHKHDMTKHNRIHTGVKLFQCEYCSRCFTFNSNLVKHVKRHQGDRQFKCHLCPKAYFEKVYLSEHMDWHKGIKRHECRICGMAYVDRQHWVRHMEKMHEIQVPPTKSGRRKTNIQVSDPRHRTKKERTLVIQTTA